MNEQKRKRGRPAIAPEKRLKHFNLYLDIDTHHEIKTLSRQHAIPASVLVRLIVERGIHVNSIRKLIVANLGDGLSRGEF